MIGKLALTGTPSFDFWHSVYNQEHNDLATDLIFDKFDSLFAGKKFNEADELLKAADIIHLNSFTMRSILAITFAYADKLPFREILFEVIYKKMIGIKGKEKTQKLIGDLK